MQLFIRNAQGVFKITRGTLFVGVSAGVSAALLVPFAHINKDYGSLRFENFADSF